MKGQTQALTAILITTVTISAISAAYVWGTPLLEKRESAAQLEELESDVTELHQSVTSVSQSGSGTVKEVSLQVPDGNLEVNPEKDYIEIETEGSGSPYPNTWTLMKGENMQNLSIGTGSYGIKGKDLPGVIAVKSLGSGGSQIKYRIEFRNLRYDGNNAQLQKIDITTNGRKTARGDITLLLSNKGTEGPEKISLASGEELQRVRNIVEVDIQ